MRPRPERSPDGRLRLPGGQMLAWSEYGARRGVAVLYHHGWPGSRLEADFADAAATALNLRIIAPDRPGYGASTQCPSRTFNDWAANAAHLLDHLGVDRCAVVGVSGGAPFALSCAAAMPARVAHVCVVSAMGPLAGSNGLRDFDPVRRLALRLARRRSRLMRGLLQRAVGPLLAQHAERFVAALARGCAPADRATLAQPAVQARIAASFREGLAASAAGAARDLELYAAPWDIPLAGIQASVDLWHGDLDGIVPPALARRLAEELPTATARFIPGEGHYSLPLGHLDTILGKVAARLTDGNADVGVHAHAAALASSPPP
ncbi:MAG: alpha/beta hydrolase [Betaproteobacteria bacterium]|nr:alpha/beta hydrolase [Betaproteobacteria bacterium]